MLKKAILILMALILIWTACAVAEEEETETAVTIPDPFRSWQGCVGDIAFSLPGMPEASLGGLMALAAVTNMPDDQYMLLISMLQEKPTWQDQIDSLPVAGWGGKLMVVCEHEDDEGVIPAAYILDMPMAD